MAGDVEAALAEACADLAQTMARPDAAGEVLHGIARQVTRLLHVGVGGVLLREADGHVNVASATDGLVASLLAVEQDVGEGPTMVAFAEGTPTRVHAVVDAWRSWPSWTSEARAHDVGAWLAVPSRSDGTTVVVSAASTRPRHWEDREVAAVHVLADLAAGWFTQEHELGRVRRTAEQLQEALDHRLVIEQAKGILAGELGCSLDQAFTLLRNHARRNNLTVRMVAHAVVNLGLRPPAEEGVGRR